MVHPHWKQKRCWQHFDLRETSDLDVQMQNNGGLNWIGTRGSAVSSSTMLQAGWSAFRFPLLWQLLDFLSGAPSLTGGQVCSLQCSHSLLRVAQDPQLYFTVSSETFPTWSARSPYLYPPGTGCPSCIPGHCVPFLSPLTTRRATIEVL
jgi:hypothetical protein